MNRRLLLLIARITCFAFVISLGVGPARSAPQSQQPQTVVNNNKPQGNGKAVVPKGCETGKMRCLSNKVRWEAAAKAADRRATKIKKNGGKGK